MLPDPWVLIRKLREPAISSSARARVDSTPATGKLVEGGIREQTRQVIRNIEAILSSADSDLAHVVKVTVFLHDWVYFREMNEVFGEFFNRKPPARSTVCGPRWPEGSLLAMEAIAVTRATR